jgi:hypothetical protein
MFGAGERAWAAWVIALVVLVSACGGEGDSEPRKSSSSSGFTTYTVESERFSIAVPDSWQTVSADEAVNDEVIDRLREANPTLAAAVEDLGKPSSVIKLLAYDPDTSQGFATNVNVGVTPVPEEVTEEQFFDVNVEQVQQAIGTAPTEEELDLPAGHALHVTWEVPGLEGTPVADQYLFYTKGRAFILTFSTKTDLTDEYASTFTRSARSFRFS